LGTTDTITLTTSDAAKDDNIQCTITATDGTDSVDSVANVTVMNSVPTIDSLSLSPALIYTNTDVQAVATGSDLEGSVLTWNYTWFVDGTQVQDGSSDTLSSTFFVKDQIVSVDVTVNDGDDTSATQSDSEIVSNSVPTAPVVSISPTDPVEGVDDLICSVDTASTDADGDAITYTFEWTVDGTAYTGATDSAMDSIVDAVEIVADEVWECMVTPDDGTDFGLLTSDAVNVTTTSACGSILHEDPYQLGVPTGWVLCYIDETDTAYHNTPCNQLLQDLDNGWGSSDLLSAGGNFGCWHGSSQTPEGASYATNNVVSSSCRDNIQQSTVLSAWNTNTTTLGVCIKYP
jgi:predicted secreted protein